MFRDNAFTLAGWHLTSGIWVEWGSGFRASRSPRIPNTVQANNLKLQGYSRKQRKVKKEKKNNKKMIRLQWTAWDSTWGWLTKICPLPPNTRDCTQDVRLKVRLIQICHQESKSHSLTGNCEKFRVRNQMRNHTNHVSQLPTLDTVTYLEQKGKVGENSAIKAVSFNVKGATQFVAAKARSDCTNLNA